MSGTPPPTAHSPSKPPIGSTSASGLPKPAAILDAPPGPSNQPFDPAPKYQHKSWSNPSDSLMNRMSGPSDQKAGLSRDPDEVKRSVGERSGRVQLPGRRGGGSRLMQWAGGCRIIYEASKGSKFFLDQQRRDEELTIKGEP